MGGLRPNPPEADVIPTAVNSCLVATSASGGFASLRMTASRMISSDLPILHTIFEIRNEFQKTGVTGIVMKTGLDIVSGRSWNVHEWEKR